MADDAARAKSKRDVPTRRARHKNSHTGCLTCKRRHLKCDEARPSCVRCQIANRLCVPVAPKDTQSPSRPHTLRGTSPHDPQAYADSCVQHFENVTLPAFHWCEPSALWEYLRAEISRSSSIRSLAEALGHEHRAAEDPAVRGRPDALNLYPRAVHMLQRAIADAELDDEPVAASTIVFHCLLLVILQCFRRAFDELNIHLRHGLRLASQAVADPRAASNVPLYECLRLLKQYSISVALFNPLLPQDPQSAALTSNQALSDPEPLKAVPRLSTLREDDQVFKDEAQDLVLDLIGTTLTYRKPHMNVSFHGDLRFDRPLVADETLIAAVTNFRARHAAVTLAIEQRLHLCHGARVQHLRISEATMILLGVYLRRRWSGYQTSWDLEAHTFADVVEKIRTALVLEAQLSVQGNASKDSSPAFSLSLGTIAPLFYVALMCRDPAIRRAAVDLLHKGPRQDGPWNARLAGLICTTIIAFEEREAAKDHAAGFVLTGYIPEHCRVVYYYYFHVTDTASGRIETEYLRVYRRQSGNEAVYIHEDLQLDTSELD